MPGVDGLTRPAEMLGLPAVRLDLSQRPAERIAFVIGNGRYAHAKPLPNATADATAVADLLRRAGYVVHSYEDLDKRGFEGLFRRLLREIGPTTETLIYYAGHGLQIGGSNRLLPVDAAIDSPYDLPFETVSLGSLLAIAGSRARSLVVILDSCRDNPFPGQEAIVGLDALPEALRTGFVAEDTPVNTLLVFSTSPGARALDGEPGTNSPFTLALEEVAAASGPRISLDRLFRDVRLRVYDRTEGRQLPWESSSLVEEVAFDLAPAAAPAVRSPDLPSGTALALTLPFDRRVGLGPALLPALQGRPGLRLADAPRDGRLEIGAAGTFRGMEPGTLAAGDLGGVVYAREADERPALALAEPRLRDRFVLATGDRLQPVELVLEIDACDREAGDYLDPEGSGLARYPNEIDPAAAEAACRAALEREPGSGRFAYQLGRALLAKGDLDGAEAAFERARAAGHTRAWQALGLLAIQRQKATGGAAAVQAPEIALAYLSMGVERGDPYAFNTLGQQLLDFGATEPLRQQGYELLSRALEVGHTFSMNALGAYFLRKDSGHEDPRRALRYFEESARRGDIYGYANMGYMTLNGLGGLSKDRVAAADWYRRAAEGGHPTAPTSLGRMASQPAEALRWFDEGLARGDGWGGVLAARAILADRPSGLTPADAAVRAAKAAALRNAAAANAAERILAELPPAALDAGTQRLMADLGEPVPVDGAFGAGSRAALDRIAARQGQAVPEGRAERLRLLGRIYWTTQRLRVDLY